MTEPARTAEVVALIQAQDQALSGLYQTAETALLVPVTGFGQWYDHPAITDLSTMLAGLMSGFRIAAARSVDGFMAQIISVLAGKKFSPLGIRNTQLARSGVTPAGVFGRLADTYRYTQALWDRQAVELMSAGVPVPPEVPRPLEAATRRLQAVVASDVQLATRNQAAEVMKAAGEQGLITGYRRVIHPELSRDDRGTCGLCIAASTRIYKVVELMSIHPGCHCTVIPIRSKGGLTLDPGGAINDSDLAQLYGDAGSTQATDLRNTRYRVDQHGELGPVIRPADQPIRTKREALADGNSSPRKAKTPAQRLASLQAKRQQMVEVQRQMDELQARNPDADWSDFRNRLASRVSDLDSDLSNAA